MEKSLNVSGGEVINFGNIPKASLKKERMYIF